MTNHTRSMFAGRKALFLLLVVAAAALGSLQPRESSAKLPAPPNEEAAKAAFLAAYPVFMHPRCMNCHPVGDAPLQGDDSRPHAQNVQRNRDGKGKYALKC
ncbi:MAG: hypothetical protein ACRD5I_02885, partial [Candidatus Acidiferrales bacterium]